MPFQATQGRNCVFCYHTDISVHRYQHTVRVCALQKDLSNLPYGDLTEVSRAGSSAPLQWHGSMAAQVERGRLTGPSSIHI